MFRDGRPPSSANWRRTAARTRNFIPGRSAAGGAAPDPLYDAHLAGWRSLEVQVNNRSCVVTEKLWFNFAPDRVHWASFAGRDFTHRQTVRRKAASWGRRYEAMPRAERLAVLAAIMAVEAGE